MSDAATAGARRSGVTEIDSALLGALAVPLDQTFTFERGILGLPDARTFALIPGARAGLFWLQSLESTALTFLLADPFRFVDGYSIELGRPELGVVTPDDADDLLVLAIVTLPREPHRPATVNLQGPLAFNVRSRGARQVVLDSPWGIRHPVDLRRGASGVA